MRKFSKINEQLKFSLDCMVINRINLQSNIKIFKN